MNRFPWLALFAAGFAALRVASPACAQTAYPMLMSLRPVAVQAGSAAEVTVSSRYNLRGAYQVLVGGQGVAGEVLPAAEKVDDPAKRPTVEKLKLRFTAAANALPGVRDVRLGTPQGASTVAQLVVVRDPVVYESSANDTVAAAQAIALPAAVCGAIEKNEDVDFYRFTAEAGTSLAFVVRCARLQDRIHDLQTHADPLITLRTASGATIAAADNSLYHADPVLTHRFETAGEYLLEIRDVRYQGNAYWEYCLEISPRPYVDCVHPLAVSPGQAPQLSLVGHLLPAEAAVNFTAPPDASGMAAFTLPLPGGESNPVPLLVSDLPLAIEAPPPTGQPHEPQRIAIPSGVSGRLEHEGEVDRYAFEARKGDALSLEVLARRLRSALDAQLRITDAQGKQLVLNDDLRQGRRTNADALIENWIVPADGKYIVEVRDVHFRGGAAFPYFLKVVKSQPFFELYLDADKSQLAPGGCAAIFARVERKNGFTGEVQLAIEGLPPGVTAHCGRILADKGQDGCIILEAAADAPLAIHSAIVRGTATHKTADGQTLELAAVAVPYQEIYQPGGGRGHWPVESHAVAITAPADIRGLTLSDYDLVLKPGESKKIEVKIDRSAGFTANVTLDMLMRHLNTIYASTLPPGVTLNDKDAKSLLTGDASEGYLTLTAAKDAPPVEKQQCVVLAHVALNFVMKWTYASRPVTITVEK